MYKAQKHKQTTHKRAICGICPAGCWVVVEYDDKGMIETVTADESSALGMICRLGEHSREIVYSKDRLRHPLKRVGPKGSYEFKPISWDEAFNIIVDRHIAIKAAYGPEAAAIYTGRGSFELAMCDVFQPKGVAVSSASSVLFPFGSPNTLGVGALCYVSFAMIAPHVTMGGMMINMFSDIENADLIVVWGANPATDCPPLDYKRIIEASNRGVQIIVIDPRKTMAAKLQNARWIPIRPGTDGALALALCNVIIEEELYDEGFVSNWTVGFDDFARYVQHFRAEAVESITSISSQTIRDLARTIANARGAAPVMYSGLEYSDSGVQAIRAANVLWALAGHLDTAGGRCFTMPENHFKVNRDGLIPNPDMSKALGKDRFPVYSLYRGESHAISLCESVLEGRPYKIRSLIILGGSIITAWPAPSVWRRTLGSLDFLVTIDRTLTADAAYADIVLPATTMYEIQSYMIYGNTFRIREKVIEPVGQARNDFFIMAELAARLGYGHLYPQTEQELLSHVLKGTGFTLQDVVNSGGAVSLTPVMMQYKKWEKGLLRPDRRPGFDTPSGKFEIASSILEEYGYDPLPVYTEPAEGPLTSPSEFYQRFPLIFNSGSRVTTD
ncbi:MAG: molybdopterin-dependent oxidoreductase, partial [Candidatus Magnetominusculus sp. LBB02]|nr:molybdopterin-dependent oxidoreductase [Candidatus Magnetominusculus sp. LBB02]